MVRHVASHLDKDMVIGGQRTAASSTTHSQIDRGATANRSCRGVALADPSVAVAARVTAMGRWGLARGGSGAADLQRGGGDGAEMGERERVCARINIPSGWFFACLIPRTAAKAQHLTPRIGQNIPHTKFFV
jgi:hypothetical protein